MKMVAPQLLEQTMKQNRQMKNEIADLKGEIIELRDKLSVIHRVIAS
jgi:hypothetical protein